MVDKELKVLGAKYDLDVGNYQTEGLHLDVVLTYLKGEPVVQVDLTPTKARELAIQLLQAAEQAERRVKS